MKQPSFASEASIQVIEQLEENGYEAVFVGGVVRDYLLGKQATDIDIATSAEPTEVQAIFSNTVDIGMAHGTILVLTGGESIEVTTYRAGETDGTVHTVKSLREDLRRRDFTINALAMTKDGELIDCFGGQKDLKQQSIRAVGNPTERFKEDALRLLRAVRFAAVLNFTIEEKTFESIKTLSNNLGQVAVERVKIEMDKIFLGTHSLKGLVLLIESGLHQALPLFPAELTHMEKCLPFHATKIGWAHFMLIGHFTAREVSVAYKLSNDEKRFLSHVEKAYKNRVERSFTIDDYYLYDANILFIVEKLYIARYSLKEEISVETFIQKKAALPIQSKRDLAVSGQDLLKWAKIKGGRWVGEWMQKIEYAVLHGQCKNESDRIKEWFINDFDGKR